MKATTVSIYDDSYLDMKGPMEATVTTMKPNTPPESEPWQYSPVASLRPKRRSKVEEIPVNQPMPEPEPLPAPIAAPPRTPRIKRSGTPHQVWKLAPEPGVAIPSKSLSAQQLIEWLVRSPFSPIHIRHSH